MKKLKDYFKKIEDYEDFKKKLLLLKKTITETKEDEDNKNKGVIIWDIAEFKNDIYPLLIETYLFEMFFRKFINIFGKYICENLDFESYKETLIENDIKDIIFCRVERAKDLTKEELSLNLYLYYFDYVEWEELSGEAQEYIDYDRYSKESLQDTLYWESQKVY